MLDHSELITILSKFLKSSLSAATALAGAMRQRDYEAKRYLYHQGDFDVQLWLLLEGVVQLKAASNDGQTTIISAFGPGQLVGGVSDNGVMSYDALTLTTVKALELDPLHLRGLLQDWPELGVGLSHIYAGQLGDVLDRLAVRVTLSAFGRFYRELLRLAGNSDVIKPSPIIAALALSAQTTRETGSRATSALERRGIIQRDPDRLTILSRRMLEELVT